MESRLASGSTDLSNDPSDPDLQLLAGLKEKLLNSEAAIASSKGVLGANNPKMLAEQANQASIRKQMVDATDKMRQHLKEHISTMQAQIATFEASEADAQKKLIATQAQRDRMGQLQRNVEFRLDQLNARVKAAEQAKLQSKLTFSEITVLDKAVPPIAPAFPKPFVVIPVGIGAGLVLGLILALLAEAMDRRVRFPIDLEYSASAPFLGSLEMARRTNARVAGPRASLRPA